jgi:hypothetical protein
MTWKHRFKLRGKSLKKHKRQMKIRKKGLQKEKVFKQEILKDDYD